MCFRKQTNVSFHLSQLICFILRRVALQPELVYKGPRWKRRLPIGLPRPNAQRGILDSARGRFARQVIQHYALLAFEKRRIHAEIPQQSCEYLHFEGLTSLSKSFCRDMRLQIVYGTVLIDFWPGRTKNGWL